MSKFLELLSQVEELHERKRHDYSSDDSPYSNYYFAGTLGRMFSDSHDVGFVTRIGEKIFRLANLDNNKKSPKNEAIEDTELDLVVIMTLWMASRRDRRDKRKADEENYKQVLPGSSAYNEFISNNALTNKTHFYCEMCRTVREISDEYCTGMCKACHLDQVYANKVQEEKRKG